MRVPKELLGRVNAFVDWFIPPGTSSDAIQGVRMFLFSHLFGPFLGHTISISMLVLQGYADQSWWIFFIAVTLFWPFTIVLRLTGWYLPLALTSIQNLIFCIFWGSYHYGGMSSPILPWLITVPLLAFFYLPWPRTRIVVSCLIVANLIAFYFIYTSYGFPETVGGASLVVLGLVSTFCAGVYVSMMALYYSSIVTSQAELEHEVELHRVTERQLRLATEAVERATRAKSEFLARMSHELRNPLNAIIGYSELLIESSPRDGSQSVQDLESIKDAGHRLLKIVNDLLDLSKLEAGKMELHMDEFAIADLVHGLAEKWKPVAAQNGNELRLRPMAALGMVAGDAEKLRQALDNLLSNALKYTTHGTVTLSASVTGDWAEISVRDTGIGISPERLNNLFETFGSQEHETSSNYGDDPGLGLPLTQRLCRLMGGDLVVESKLNGGSCFTIRIPYHPLSAAA